MKDKSGRKKKEQKIDWKHFKRDQGKKKNKENVKDFKIWQEKMEEVKIRVPHYINLSNLSFTREAEAEKNFSLYINVQSQCAVQVYFTTIKENWKKSVLKK